MSKEHDGTTRRPSRPKWRWQRSRVSGRLHSWRISSTSTQIRSRVGKRSWKAVRRICSGRAAAKGPTTPPVDVKALHAKIGELTLENDF